MMSWPDGEHYLRSLQSLVVAFLLSILFFSRNEGVRSHLKSLTHRFPRFPPRNLCSLSPSLCSLSSTLQRTLATVRLSFLQDWQNREFILQRLQTLVPGHLSFHFPLTSYGLFALLTLWPLYVSIQPLVQAMGSCPASGAPWSSAMHPFFGRGRVTITITEEL